MHNVPESKAQIRAVPGQVKQEKATDFVSVSGTVQVSLLKMAT